MWGLEGRGNGDSEARVTRASGAPCTRLEEAGSTSDDFLIAKNLAKPQTQEQVWTSFNIRIRTIAAVTHTCSDDVTVERHQRSQKLL